MSRCQHIGIVVILTYGKVFVGPNCDAGVGLGVGVDFCFEWIRFLHPTLKRIRERISRFRSVCVEKGVVISRFKMRACAVT
jgi:hypothetical protein